MHSITSAFKANATGDAPKELGYLPTLKLNDGNEIPMVCPCPTLTTTTPISN